MTSAEMVEVIEAYDAGELIEQRSVDHRELGWKECPFPNWDFYRVEFRIKPKSKKPREWWIHVKECERKGVFQSHKGCVDCILVREVVGQ